MKYYLLTIEEFNENHADCLHAPAYNLNNTQCIIEVEEGAEVSNYLQGFETSHDVNSWRYSESESVNWIPDNEFD